MLHIKGIEYINIPVNLLKGEQSGDYLKINPNGTLPTAIFPNGFQVSQSTAIIELLEELHPALPLLPKDAYDRASVREIMALISCDIHPVQNLRVLNKVGQGAVRIEWGNHFINLGFFALEKLLEKTSGKYCFKDTLTLADVYLVPQVYNALRFSVDMSQFPRISKIHSVLVELEPFKLAHPDSQVDCVDL